MLLEFYSPGISRARTTLTFGTRFPIEVQIGNMNYADGFLSVPNNYSPSSQFQTWWLYLRTKMTDARVNCPVFTAQLDGYSQLSVVCLPPRTWHVDVHLDTGRAEFQTESFTSAFACAGSLTMTTDDSKLQFMARNCLQIGNHPPATAFVTRVDPSEKAMAITVTHNSETYYLLPQADIQTSYYPNPPWISLNLDL